MIYFCSFVGVVYMMQMDIPKLVDYVAQTLNNGPNHQEIELINYEALQEDFLFY